MATHSCSCLEKPSDRGAWWTTVHVVAKSCTQLSGSHFHKGILFYFHHCKQTASPPVMDLGETEAAVNVTNFSKKHPDSPHLAYVLTTPG